jgi:menaquinone-specific isochorismate synthase
LVGNGPRRNRRIDLDSNRMEIDLSRPALDGRLGRVLREAAQRAHRQRRAVLVSVTEPIPAADPVAIFGNAAGICKNRLLWMQPDRGFSLTGIGAAHIIEKSGPARFSKTAVEWEALRSEALIDQAAEGSGSGPLLMGGFSFDIDQPPGSAWEGYPEGRMVLPRVCLSTSEGSSSLTFNAVLHPDIAPEAEAAEIARARRALIACAARSESRPAAAPPTATELRSCDGWRREVAAASRAVRAGELRKVVLARAVRLQNTQPFDPAIALRRLRTGYPTCVVFAVANGERCFLGATPERLLRVRNGEASATCLAGSYARGTGEAADRQLAEALLADPKERSEHALVLTALVDTLGAACIGLRTPDSPSVLKLPNVQHLCTPLVGRVAPGQGVLRIVERLHPTPSVGGAPRELALKFIREREGLDRGWYAGAVGWVDHKDEGEFAVAIRAALLEGAQAILFAGCGIVADSDPEREFAESCIKLTPMLTALGAT